MTKYIILFILLVASLLTACQEEFEPRPEPSVTGEELILNVNASHTVVTNQPDSRAYDSKEYTYFDEDEKVGLIIFDDAGHILAENLPYVYNFEKDDEDHVISKSWNLDVNTIAEENASEYKRNVVYFDKTMTTYIVYYPYDKSVGDLIHGKTAEEINAIKSFEAFSAALRNLPVYEWQEDQTEEINYRYSDPMMWYASGDDCTSAIDATLGHLRNSFCLDPKIHCVLNNGHGITYRPKNYILNDKFLPSNLIKNYEYETGFEELKIYKDGEPLKLYDVENASKDNKSIVYCAEDGSYRYIIPENTKYTFKWRYFYRGNTYGGVYETYSEEGTPEQGVRFLIDETADIGKYADDNLRVSDYFCKGKDSDGKIIGFPFPWEAVDELDPEQCLGVIFLLGLTGPADGAISAATDTLKVYGNALDANPDHGYVMALTNAPGEEFPQDYIKKTNWSSERLTDVLIYPPKIATEGSWSGYTNFKEIEKFIVNEDNQAKYPGLSWKDFPAARACKLYGQLGAAFQAPENTSGWYLPSYRQLLVVSKLNAADRLITSRISVVRGILPGLLDGPDKHYYKNYVELLYFNGSTFLLDNSTEYHWSSSEENSGVDDKFISRGVIVNLLHKEKRTYCEKHKLSSYVRPILTF